MKVVENVVNYGDSGLDGVGIVSIHESWWHC